MTQLTTNDKETKHQKRLEWNQMNKDKLAEYARNHYHKRVQEDPEYRHKLRDRVKVNRLKRMEKQLTN